MHNNKIFYALFLSGLMVSSAYAAVPGVTAGEFSVECLGWCELLHPHCCAAGYFRHATVSFSFV